MTQMQRRLETPNYNPGRFMPTGHRRWPETISLDMKLIYCMGRGPG